MIVNSNNYIFFQQYQVLKKLLTMENDNKIAAGSYVDHVAKKLSREDKEKLLAQNSRIVPEFKALQIEKDAKKHWDLFYKRNESRFFKDRHWTTREFEELLGYDQNGVEIQKILLEVGCGVGNFVYPLLEERTAYEKIYACDLSTRAIELVKVSVFPFFHLRITTTC